MLRKAFAFHLGVLYLLMELGAHGVLVNFTAYFYILMLLLDNSMNAMEFEQGMIESCKCIHNIHSRPKLESNGVFQSHVLTSRQSRTFNDTPSHTLDGCTGYKVQKS